MQAGVASQILHLLKPTVFPILNDPGRKGYINKLELPLVKADGIHQYIHNAKIICDFRDRELPDKNFRTIDVGFWGNQNTATISYWLGGARYGENNEIDMTQEFIENGVYGIGFENEDISNIIADTAKFNDWINNLTNSAAKKAFERFSQISAGDRIAIKSAFPKKMPAEQRSVSTLRIKAIGTVLENFEDGYRFSETLGHTISVEWENVNLNVDYALGKYMSTPK